MQLWRSSAVASRAPPAPAHRRVRAAAFKVELTHEGKTHVLEVPQGSSILEVALDKGLDLPHDCKLGVCMTCPAKLVKGTVDQSGCMLSDDITEKGYALLCVAQPTSDCKIQTISEDELLDMQFGM
nr:chloroplast ferredoxin-4 [Chlamydomonas sp. UWO 241]